ncbi:anaerobic ribonucleoside-triphosphate reductase activating protein [candidate division WOR-3 bacterium]|nr:anaerobic ribonucleoside-triphosphate reductase activating protein [candidate division WOR-3 bacterium]
MKIGGLQKTSLLDYPDTLSAIIWTAGCNFRCPFCYNKNLVLGKTEIISEETILSFIEKRRDVLEGLSISGGEPFLQEDIVDFTEKVKKLNYLIKIDTNGAFPEKLKELIDKKLVDYVSMDVKAPKKKYDQLAGVKTDISKIEQSIDLIKNEAPDYEFKTTIVPVMLDKKDIVEIAKWLEGSKQFYLQQFKSDSPLVSSKLNDVAPYSKEKLSEMLHEIKPFFKNCNLRGV